MGCWGRMSARVYMCGHAKKLIFPQQGGGNPEETHEESDWFDKKQHITAKGNETQA